MLASPPKKRPKFKASFPRGWLQKRFEENAEVSLFLVFSGLLFTSAGLLIYGSVEHANTFALGAYFILCVTLILQITSLVRMRKTEGNQKNG